MERERSEGIQEGNKKEEWTETTLRVGERKEV